MSEMEQVVAVTVIEGEAKRAAEVRAKQAKAKARRKAREEAMSSVGMVKVRSASGRVYWE